MKGKGKGRKTYRSNTGLSNGEETRKETVLGLGLARLSGRRGHDAVVLGVEPELENVADVGLDVLGLEGETGLADLDGDGLGGDGGGKGQGGGDEDVAERRHFEALSVVGWKDCCLVGWYGLGW